jgi:hypothetical protein
MSKSLSCPNTDSVEKTAEEAKKIDDIREGAATRNGGSNRKAPLLHKRKKLTGCQLQSITYKII